MPFSNKDKIETLKTFLVERKNVVITSHKSPDGDSIGSSLGLYHFLKSKGIKATICHPDPAPTFLNWLKDFDLIFDCVTNKSETEKQIIQSDLIFCLDYNSFSRTGEEMSSCLIKSNAPKIMIDHHLHPTLEFDLVFSDIGASSTSELIYELIEELNDTHLLNENIAQALYCGIMTDTGSFRYSCTTSRTHYIVSKLISTGINPSVIHENVYDSNSVNRLKLYGFCISNRMEIIENFATVILYLTKEDLLRYDYQKGDAEGIVNVGLSIKGINKSILLLETAELVKISFRSKGDDNPINQLASSYFNGGGHANASGGNFIGSVSDAIIKLKSVLPEFCKK